MPDNNEATAQAEELCDEAVDQYVDGKCGDSFTVYAMCHQSKGDLDAAIEVTKRYVEVEREDLLGFTNLSMFYQKKGMIKEAEAAGAEARRLDWKRQLKEAKEKGKGD